MSTSNTNVHVGPNTTATPNPLINTVQSVAHGTLPHNAQLTQTIGQSQAALDEIKYEAPLSAKGHVLVDDVKNVLDSAARMINEKNQNEALQRAVASGAQAGRETRGVTGGSMPLGRSDMKDLRGPARGLWDNGKSVAVFAVRSQEFRSILVEILDLLQGIVRNTKSNLASQSGSTSAQEFAQDMSNDTMVTEDQKQALFDKFRTLLGRLGSQPQYYTAMDHLFHLFDQISEKADRAKSDPNVPSPSELPTQRYDQLWQESKEIMEQFSGVGTFDELERRIWTLVHLMKADPEARQFLQTLRQYMLEVTRNPQLLQNDAEIRRGRMLMDEAQYLFRGKYRPQFNDIFEQTRMILLNIQNDTARQDFSAKLHKLGADFAFDDQGRPDLFVIQESLSQMRTILIPFLTRQLAHLPIPKIEGANPKYDFSIDGMILHVADLLPQFVNIQTKTDTRMNVQRLATQKNSTKIMEVDQIRAVFKDIRFFYRRKRVPRIEDHGIADVDLSQGTGVSVKIVWKLKSRMNQPYLLRLLKVKCSIDRLAITVRNAKHNIIDKLATKLFAGTIKKQVANAIVNNIINTLTPLSVKLNDLFKRKPITGVVGRANDQMKSALFTGESGQQSLISRAKETISEGVHSVKNTSTTGTSSMASTVPVTVIETPYIGTTSTPVTFVEEPLTFVEKDRSINRGKDWAFEWYNSSSNDVVEQVIV